MARYTNLKISSPKDSEITITGEIPQEVLSEYRKEAINVLRMDFELPGFRKGKVPEDIFLKHVDEYHVLEDAASEALRDAYGEIVKDNEIRTLGMPEVTITKMAPGNVVEFKITVGIVPEFSLPNYKKLAKEIKLEPVPETTEKEIEDVIAQLKQMLALQSSKSGGGTAHSSISTGEQTQELTDEFVKKLGNFQDVADFKNKLKENLKAEKEIEAKKKHREEMVAHIVKGTKITIPKSIVEQEVGVFKERLEADLKSHDTTLADYLTKVKKTEAELLDEERNYIDSQLKTKFIIDRIAQEENIKPEESEIMDQMRTFEERRPDIKPESSRYYAESMLKTEKVLELLEGSAARN